MAYARFGKESDVFAYESVGGFFECLCCCRTTGDAVFETRSKMIAHLREHRLAGDKVPDRAFYVLEQEILQYGETTEPVDIDELAAKARAEKANRKLN